MPALALDTALLLLIMAPVAQWPDLGQSWQSMVNSFWSFIDTYIVKPIGGAFQSIVGSISSAVTGAFEAIRSGLMSIFSGIANAITSYFAGFGTLAHSAFQTLTTLVGGNPAFAMLILVLIPVLVVLAIVLVIKVGRFAL